MKLRYPPKNLRLFRLRPKQGCANSWHILRDGKVQTAQCGKVIPICKSVEDEIEYDNLEKLTKGKLCTSCWPWGTTHA